MPHENKCSHWTYYGSPITARTIDEAIAEFTEFLWGYRAELKKIEYRVFRNRVYCKLYLKNLDGWIKGRWLRLHEA